MSTLIDRRWRFQRIGVLQNIWGAWCSRLSLYREERKRVKHIILFRWRVIGMGCIFHVVSWRNVGIIGEDSSPGVPFPVAPITPSSNNRGHLKIHRPSSHTLHCCRSLHLITTSRPRQTRFHYHIRPPSKWPTYPSLFFSWGCFYSSHPSLAL